MNFLIIDDSPTSRRMIINALKSFGFENFTEAVDGKDGLEKLNSNEIDFIITEWDMPIMTGLDLTKTIRKSEKFADMPILIVSTRGLKEDILEALKAKVSNYIVKPFVPIILKEKIAAIIKTKMKENPGSE